MGEYIERCGCFILSSLFSFIAYVKHFVLHIRLKSAIQIKIE